MTNVLFIGSSMKKFTVDSNVTTWGQLMEVATGIDFKSVQATDLTTRTVYAHDSSVLNVVNGTVKIHLAPIQGFKGGANYDFDYTIEDVAGLDYVDLKAELKEIRRQANEMEDEDTVTLIGNYTRMSVADLRTKLVEVYTVLGNVPETSNDNGEGVDTTALEAELAALKARVVTIELTLGLLNDENSDAFANLANEFGASL